MARVIKVDEIVRTTDKCIHVQFANLDNPTYLPFSRGNAVVNTEARLVDMAGMDRKMTAKALGLTVDQFEAEYS